MIKACQKKILYIEGQENTPFEAAYFVLRDNAESISLGGDDILKEADRIINERLPDVKSKRLRIDKIKKAVWVGVSAVSGALLGCGSAMFFFLAF